MIVTGGERVGTPRGVGTVIGFLLQDGDGVRFVRRRSRGRPAAGTRVFPVVKMARTGRRHAFQFEHLFEPFEGPRRERGRAS